MRRTGRVALLHAETCPARFADFATRDAVIARQGHRARWIRRLRRGLRALGRLAAVALGLAVIGVVGSVAAYWLRTTPLLAVTRVEVVGAQRLEPEAVRAAAGVERGANLLALDPAAIERRVLALPGVASARVVRHVPDRVQVVVEEREPYALVNPEGGNGLVWVDAAGRLIGPERRPGAPPLPVLSGVEPSALAAHGPVADRLAAGLALLRTVQRTGGRLARRLSEIDLTPAEGPVLYTVDGIAVRLGVEAWAERLARLDGVLAELDERGEPMEAVDLRFRDLVVLRPRPAAAPEPADAGPGRPATTPKPVERN